MRKWGKHSAIVYAQLDQDLQLICNYILKEVMDVSLLCGHRTEEAQDRAFRSGYSQLRWPNGKHNKYPSIAVDMQPFPLPKDDLKLWASLGYMAGAAIAYAKSKGITLRWGGDWNGNGDITDQRFDDLYHLELVE